MTKIGKAGGGIRETRAVEKAATPMLQIHRIVKLSIEALDER
jgi:hypothetical protein